MQRITIVLLLILNFSCYAQNALRFEYDNFEKQFLSYEPVQNPNVIDKDFQYGLMIVKETKKALKNNPKNFNVADYFNVLSAFLTLKESEVNIRMAFEKFKNAENSCNSFLAFEKDIENNPKYDIIRLVFNKQLSICKSKTKRDFNISEYCKTNGLDRNLVEKIVAIEDADQKYRKRKTIRNYPEHKELDKQNQILIDSLYSTYKTYIGKSQVGGKFENVMWSVVQHSNPEFMGKYLPIIQKAFKEKEIDIGPFKMLIDRFYGLKYGYQIFGTQSGFGFKLANAKTRKEIETKYGLE